MDGEGERNRMHRFTKEHYVAARNMRGQLIPDSYVIEMVGDGERILDAGCGDGYYSVLFSRFSRSVVAVDSNDIALRMLAERITEEKIDNIIVEKANLCDYVPHDAGLIFMSNSFHDLNCKENFIQKAVDSLDWPIFTLIEFKKNTPFGPPENIRFSESELESFFRRWGYTLDRRKSLTMHYIHRYVISR